MSDETPIRVEQATSLGVEEAASLYGVHPQTIYRLARGELPHYRIGRAIRFDPDELRAYFARHPVGASA